MILRLGSVSVKGAAIRGGGGGASPIGSGGSAATRTGATDRRGDGLGRAADEFGRIAAGRAGGGGGACAIGPARVSEQVVRRLARSMALPSRPILAKRPGQEVASRARPDRLGTCNGVLAHVVVGNAQSRPTPSSERHMSGGPPNLPDPDFGLGGAASTPEIPQRSPPKHRSHGGSLTTWGCAVFRKSPTRPREHHNTYPTS